MSDDPGLEKLLEDYAAARTKLRIVQDAAASHARVLDRIVELLKSGRVQRKDFGRAVESYLSGSITTLLKDLLDACDERDTLKEKLVEYGVIAED